MRFRTKLLAVLPLLLPVASAETWSVTNAGFEMNVSKGGGRMIGPLEMKYRGWVLSATREATVSSESKIVKSLRADGSKEYSVKSGPAIIVFLDGCKAVDAGGAVVFESTFMILDMEKGTLSSTGVGIVQRDGTRIYRSADADSTVLVELATGAVSRSGEGWTHSVVAAD